MALFFTWIDTPVARIKVIAEDETLSAIVWHEPESPVHAIEDPCHPILRQTKMQLESFFKGERLTFDIPLQLRGTSFQNDVWRALTEIPFGQTVSYLSIAQKIGRPKAVRAVGMAIGKNPYSIIIPCHRVIGTNGSLTGFAGGVAVKQKLLEFESSRKI
jgi:methylated-DNA-[protein]-cysteine S-methyltransferase